MQRRKSKSPAGYTESLFGDRLTDTPPALSSSAPISTGPSSPPRESWSRYARVALPVPLGRAFTYAVPRSLDVTPGARVFVEFGRRKCLGVVVEIDLPAPDIDPDKLKPILQIIDPEPALPPELLSFLLELARYYFAPLGEVLRLALPSLERGAAEEIEKQSGKKWKSVGRLVQVVHFTPREEWPEGAQVPSAGRARELIDLLEQSGPQELSRLTHTFSTARALTKKLEQLGLIRVTREEKEIDPFFEESLERDTPPRLNAEQASAVQALSAALDAKLDRAFLLDGVTASGKTEVYLHAAEHALRHDQGVILLVPEIALTPQLVGRFRARLGDSIAVLHSGLKETARLHMWRSLREGRVKVAIGARSAIFAPVRDLGLICIDEEHDSSYKQEEGVRYSARDMALLRAKRANAVCVLGSATPSLSSEAAVRGGQLTRLRLRTRAHGSSTLPDVEIIDLRRMGPGPSQDPLLSLPLHRALEENLDAGGQSILFLNRRGFAPSLLCMDCGTILECPHCSVALTLHRAQGSRLECHYCDLKLDVPVTCPVCGSLHLSEEGLGTERVESLLHEHFPTARVARLDRDVAGGTKSAPVLDAMRRREIDILVGTQMVTKGHDLPHVTLVGVLNADASLSLPDFRAAERTFHLLVQVAGRAGRADQKGRVLIQTRNPEHPAVAYAARHDVASFIEHELEAREEVGYPPFSRIALVRFDGLSEHEVREEATRASRLAEKSSPEAEILGPAPAPLARLRNRFRFRFLVRSQNRAHLRLALLALARMPLSKRVRMSIDVDPMNLL